MQALLAALLVFGGKTLPSSVPYRWKSVQMVGAGFVDGIVFSPSTKNVRYARTDIGGAYRWDAAANRWEPMMDWVPFADLNLMGVESIAVDPHDGKKVYLACGTYTNATTPDGAILRSSDGGRTFAVSRVPIKFGGNENGRGNGERLSVDPYDAKHLLLGTRHDGLWESRDGASTWQRVGAFSAVGDSHGAGIVVTLFDPATKGVAYAGVSDSSGPSLYRSLDGGVTWAPVPDAPTGLYPTHVVRGSNGALWIAYSSDPGPRGANAGAVWKLSDGTWTEVTPEKGRFGYIAVSLQADRPDVAIVSSFYRSGGEQIFRTLDGGRTWKPVIGGKETYDDKKSPYVARTGIHWLFDIEIDPFNPDHALFTTGYGGHETFNLTAADRGNPVRWQVMSTGIEESVALQLDSPAKGPWLHTAIGDYGGGTFWHLDRPLPQGNYSSPHFGNTTSVASAAFVPETVVRVGHSSGAGREPNLGFSLDGGASWRPASSVPPNAREGYIAVSPDGRTWVWSLRNGAYRTTDYGTTWTRCLVRSGDELSAGLRVIPDGTDSRRFYALDLFNDRLYVSDDGGKSFTSRPLALPGGPPVRGDRFDQRGGQDQLYPTPGRSGDLWLAAFDGLYHASTGGAFVRLPDVGEIHAFGFGRSAPGMSAPALYLVGTVNRTPGIFRSDDSAKTWMRINDDAHQWGLVLQISGDPKKYGRVYVGTHGRGVFYGDPR